MNRISWNKGKDRVKPNYPLVIGDRVRLNHPKFKRPDLHGAIFNEISPDIFDVIWNDELFDCLYMAPRGGFHRGYLKHYE